MRIIQFDVGASVPWFVSRGKRAWIAICDALNMTLEADTYEQLVSVIQEAMQDFFVDLVGEGELEQFLSSHGWHPVVPIPSDLRPDEIRFDVPFTLSPLPPDQAHAC